MKWKVVIRGRNVGCEVRTLVEGKGFCFDA